MAADQQSDVDLDSFQEPEVDDSDNRIDLDPGQKLHGVITDYKPTAGDHGLVLIDGRELWLNQGMKRQLVAGLVKGNEVLHVKAADEESFEDADGEEITYNPRSLRFQPGDDS